MLRQTFAVTRLGLSTLPSRRGTSIVIVVGVACVVAVLLSMLSITAGLTRMYGAGGNPDLAIVTPKGAFGEGSSELTRDKVGTILNAPGIAKGTDGSVLADAEFQMMLMPPPGFKQDSLQVRGIGPMGTAVRKTFKIESGRMLRPGAQELMVGVGASHMFGMKMGDTLLMPQGRWPIVATFSNGGERLEGHILADAETLMAATRRTGFGSVIVKLERPDALAEFERWLTTNPSLSVEAASVSAYLLKADANQMKFFTRMTYVIGCIMALGALFGAVKILYAAVRARTREIGTLRALGFGSLPLATSVVLESAFLALLGAASGAFMAWLLFDGREVYSWGVFRLHVSPQLIALGLVWGLVIALLGGLFPAVRASRIPAAEALRAL